MIKNVFNHLKTILTHIRNNIWEIIAIVMILIGIFSPLAGHISRKMFYKDVELGSVYEYYGYGYKKDPFKQVLYYIQIIDKKNGFFQYKTYRSFDAIAKDNYINIESTDAIIMKKIIENSDFVVITDIYDKEHI